VLRNRLRWIAVISAVVSLCACVLGFQPGLVVMSDPGFKTVAPGGWLQVLTTAVVCALSVYLAWRPTRRRGWEYVMCAAVFELLQRGVEYVRAGVESSYVGIGETYRMMTRAELVIVFVMLPLVLIATRAEPEVPPARVV